MEVVLRAVLEELMNCILQASQALLNTQRAKYNLVKEYAVDYARIRMI